MTNINLREVNHSDENLLFNWRNIDELVALSYHQKKVTRTEHRLWLSKSLDSRDIELTIIQLSEKDIGSIRLVGSEHCSRVSIYLIPGNEGKGYGFKALSLALNQSQLGSCFYANIQLNNIPSQKLFIKLGFEEISRDNEFILYQILNYKN